MFTATNNRQRLAAALTAAFAILGFQSHAFANVLTVTSCADDNSSGTLRNVAAASAHGDTIDLSGLSCSGSAITLTQGEVVLAHNVTLHGPTAGTLTIASAGSGRVLNSTTTDTPSGYLNVVNLAISGGRVYTDNDYADGGCILASADLTLTNSTVTDCVANSTGNLARGGGVFAQSLTLTTSSISGSAANAAGDYQVALGGGAYVTNLTCTDGSLSGNFAASESGGQFSRGGGAIVQGGDIQANRCTIDTNSAGRGAGIAQSAVGSRNNVTLIQNSTISGNVATFGSGGIELVCGDCNPAPMQLLNSTVAFNTSPTNYGAGVYSSGAVIAQSSIVANNTGATGGIADLYTANLSGSDNLVMSTNVTPAAGVITITTDPMLLPLADNAGTTRTHALAASSPALQHGNNNALLSTDQRGGGFSRSVAGMVDIGAYESQTDTSTTSTGTATGKGGGSTGTRKGK